VAQKKEAGMKKKNILKGTVLAVGSVLLAGCIATVPASWIPAGNEMEKVVDAETGRTVVYMTAGNSIDTQFHYHGGTWGEINGRIYLFFSSSRQRPAEAGETRPGERQIMAADVETGDLYYLTTIPNDGTGSLAHINVRPYHSSYNDETKTIFFFNKKRNAIYGYNCLTGERKKMLELPAGAVSRELDDMVDEQMIRLIYPYTIRTKDGQLGYIAASDFDRELNLITNRVVVSCPTDAALNHVEINPQNKNLFFYKYHHNQQPDGRYALSQVCIKDLSKPDTEDVIVNPSGQTMDHMIWGASGKYVYWDDNAGNLMRYDYLTGKIEKVGDGSNIHNYLSSDEKLWVYDLRKDPPYFSKPFDGMTVKCWKGAIWIHDMAANTSTQYANIIWGDPHPRHPHAVFSPDDQMISFVTGQDNENSRVAVMQVGEE
jgi:hypothetical protein